MNGIDSVCIATGNDWRAIEAGAHAYAARSGRYTALTDWHVDENGDLSRNGPGDSVLRMQGSLASGVSLAIAGDATYFSYSSTGLGRPNVDGNTAVSQIVICDNRGNIVGPGGSSAARLFVVTPLGRATIISDVDLIDDALTNMNKTCP